MSATTLTRRQFAGSIAALTAGALGRPAGAVAAAVPPAAPVAAPQPAPGTVVALDSNENPYGPSPLAMCTVKTETRVWASDNESARKFARYWWTIRLGSGLIRRMWLRAIRRRAEKIGS